MKGNEQQLIDQYARMEAEQQRMREEASRIIAEATNDQ